MKKLILKTALITSGTIVALLCIVYGIMTLFFPLTLAKMYDSVGLTEASVSFYELHYESTKDVDDLGVLCVKVNEVDDSVRAKDYILELINHEEYNDYLVSFDSQNNGTITGREFFNGKLAIAIQKSSGVEEFIIFANSVVEDGYTQFNPYYVALSVKGLFSAEDLEKVNGALLSLQSGLTDGERAFLNRDIEFTLGE